MWPSHKRRTCHCHELCLGSEKGKDAWFREITLGTHGQEREKCGWFRDDSHGKPLESVVQERSNRKVRLQVSRFDRCSPQNAGVTFSRLISCGCQHPREPKRRIGTNKNSCRVRLSAWLIRCTVPRSGKEKFLRQNKRV
jgi:hypothetical protein